MSSSVNVKVSPFVKELKDKGELRVQDFTEDRIKALKKQIAEAYKPGYGIQGNKFSKILYGYQQALSMYEGIAYRLFGLVATKNPSLKTSPLYLVSVEEAGKTRYPVASSKWHEIDKVVAAREMVRRVTSLDVITGGKKDELAGLFDELSSVCSKIATVIKEAP